MILLPGEQDSSSINRIAVGINWSDPLTRGLVLCVQPAVGINLAVQSGDPRRLGTWLGTTRRYAATLSMDGNAGRSGLSYGPGPILSGRDNCTLLVRAITRGALLVDNANNDTSTDDGRLGNGNTLYSERTSADSGRSIFKLDYGYTNFATRFCFTYRNSSNQIIQQYFNGDGFSEPGQNTWIAGVTVSGSQHTIFWDHLRYGFRTNVASFTSGHAIDSGVIPMVGADYVDNRAVWNGELPLALGWSRTLSDQELALVRANPERFLVFEEDDVWVPMVATTVPGINLAAAPGVSQPQGASVAITQTHKLVGAPGLSQVAAGVGAVVQTHLIAAAAGISQPAAASVAIGQAHVLVAAAGVSQPVGASVAVSQVHVLGAAPGTSTPIAASVAIGTAGQLLASPGVSQPVGASVAITQVHVLAASPGVSTPSGASLAITQAHRLAAAPGASLAMAAPVAIVQRHVLAAALGTSQPVGPSVSLSTESNFEASIWRKYRVPAEDRMFKIAAEQRKFGVTDG